MAGTVAQAAAKSDSSAARIGLVMASYSIREKGNAAILLLLSTSVDRPEGLETYLGH